jgi:putative hydroxymethylpyrimidine transport system ATP-binding protein
VLFDQFNLAIPAQKCVCLLGPSGVGKSTLLRLIAHLITNTDTKTLNFKITTSDNLPLNNRIAYMAQQDLLMPWLSIIDNVLLGYKLRGGINKNVKNKALDLLRKVGLAEIANKRPKILSGGMRQRVALARTLMENHPIILMDEPFSALDAVSRLRLQDFAAELFQAKTVLLVTHDPLEALRISDIIYVLSGKPVKLSQPIIPAGKTPRDPIDPALIKLQAKLLVELTHADQEFCI